MKTWREYLSPIVYLSNNLISLIGVVIVTTAAVLWLLLLPSSFHMEGQNPYLGILSWLILPGVFIFGLILIPLGIWFQWRKTSGGRLLPENLPSLDLQNPKLRRLAIFVIATTAVNLLIASHGSYTAVEYMDSVTFCGLTCHTVMKPEFTAYQNSPHSRVECVKCHIGPGASWFVKSKLSGVRQVFAVALNTYERPIPTPVQNLRPARDTCEACHWPDKYGGERLRLIEKFSDDEQNSKTTTVLMMHIGGSLSGGHRGIHGAHVGKGVTIKYRPEDEKRSKIPWASREVDGKTAEYVADGAKDWQKIPERTMDCVDCHNRPTHIYEMPDRGMDRVMHENTALASLPFFKKQGVELLKGNYASQEVAEKEIPAKLAAYYKQSYPNVKPELVEAGGKAVFSVYARNVFPEMRLTWGSYTNNIGHMDFPGCFRCHDDGHVQSGSAGIKLTQDCSTCHEVLAMEEKDPKILESLGLVKPAATAPTPAGH
jgi:nitrate/TMAO reductase-like tetraheme cytochrome c subunit